PVQAPAPPRGRAAVGDPRRQALCPGREVLRPPADTADPLVRGEGRRATRGTAALAAGFPAGLPDAHPLAVSPGNAHGGAARDALGRGRASPRGQPDACEEQEREAEEAGAVGVDEDQISGPRHLVPVEPRAADHRALDQVGAIERAVSLQEAKLLLPNGAVRIDEEEAEPRGISPLLEDEAAGGKLGIDPLQDGEAAPALLPI